MALPTTSYAARAARFEGIVVDPTTVEVIVARVAEGETLKDVATAWDVPVGRLTAWMLGDEARREQYEGALRLHAYTQIGECVPIADALDVEGVTRQQVSAAKVRIETRMKVAGFHARDVYGVQAATGGGTKINVIVNRGATPPPVETTVEAVTVEAQEA